MLGSSADRFLSLLIFCIFKASRDPKSSIAFNLVATERIHSADVCFRMWISTVSREKAYLWRAMKNTCSLKTC